MTPETVSAHRERRWPAERVAANRAKNASWKARNRQKYLAHKAVENALRAGKLQRFPCERCGATELVHAHHDDYSRHLDVMWLCPAHHRERHRQFGASIEASVQNAEKAHRPLGSRGHIRLRPSGRFEASRFAGGKAIFIGSFATPELAQEAIALSIAEVTSPDAV